MSRDEIRSAKHPAGPLGSGTAPPPAFFQTLFLVASVMALMTTGEDVFRFSGRVDMKLAPLLIAGLTDWYTCALLVVPLYWVTSRHPVERHTWTTAVPVHLLAGAAASVSKFALFVPLRGAIDPAYARSFPDALADGFVGKLIFFWSVSGILHAVFYYRRYKDLNRLRVALPAPTKVPPIEDAAGATIAVATGGAVLHLRVRDIDWIEAQGNYALIHCGEERHLVRETMSSLSARLGASSFLRVHRSKIVNVRGVKASEAAADGRYRLTLRNGAIVTSGRSYRNDLRRRLR